MQSALVFHPHRPVATVPRWLHAGLPALIVLLGVGARLLALRHADLHPDEALYAGWALRIADGSDPALLGVYVDKPPWLPYLLAGLFRLLGYPGTAPFDPARLALAGRLAAVVAAGLSLALFWLIARRLYDARTALLALALFAFSPLAVRLSATLFTDPWLLLWLLLAWWATLARRGWLAGLACGLAYAAKQQAVLFLPALAALIWLWPASSADPSRARRLAQAAQGFLLIAVLVLWWDSLRWQWMPSYWERSAAAYGGLHWAVDATLWPRLGQWLKLIGLALGLPMWLAAATLLLRHRAPAWGRTDAALLLFALAYLLLHLLTSLAPWDRYALPLVPLLALPAAQLITAAVRAHGRTLPAVTAAALLLNGAAGVSARLPLADAGLYRGVAQTATWLRREASGAVIYQHGLGWHYSFYLYGTPLELRWWATPADLAAAARPQQLLALAAGDDPTAVRAALQRRGLVLLPELIPPQETAGHPTARLYRIVPAPTTAEAPSYVR